MFRPNQYNQIVVSDIGIFLWLAGMITFGYYKGLLELLRVYFIPYLWYAHDFLPR